jgi:predicted DNA-binding transcriptional regulator AlpA
VTKVVRRRIATAAEAARLRKVRQAIAANARRAQLAGLKHTPTVNGDRHDKPAADAMPRLLSKPAIIELIGFEYPAIWKMIREGRFPHGRIVGGKTMWLSTEVSEWIANLPKRQLKAPDQKIEETA